MILTWRSLHLADGAVRRALDRRLADTAGCSLLEHDLLAWLAAAPGHRLRMLDLADRLGVTPGGLTRIIDRLTARGWIERDRPERNRREVFAVLTPAGQQAARRARGIYLSVLNQTLGRHLGKEDMDDLTRITGKLLNALAGGDPHAQGCPGIAASDGA